MNARKALTLATGVALALTLGACGNDEINCSANPTAAGCPPPPTTTPPPPLRVRTILATSTCEDIGVDVLCIFSPFTTPQRGDLDITVDWTFPEDVIQVLVSSGSCTLEQINGGQCTFLSSAPASATPKPRVITLTGVAAGTYQLYVGNRGPRTETVSIQIGLTTGGATSSSTRPVLAPGDGVNPYASQVTAR